MPRPKGKSNGTKNGDAKQSGSDRDGNIIRWCNLKLEDTDVSELASSDATVEFLAARIFEICGTGVGFSVRHIDNGESVCCTLLYTVLGHDFNTVGISSFGGNVRDALLCTVYKYDVLLDGDLSNSLELLSPSGQRKRFR